MYEQVTAEEVILAVVENMHQSLEPLLFTTWAPSLYHVYLRRHDYERLHGIFPAIADEAKLALDRELEQLNKGAKGTGGLFGMFKKEQPQKRYLKPNEGWQISFSVDDDLDETERYRIEVLLMLPPKPDFGPGQQTIRVTTVGNSGSGDRFKTIRRAEESRASRPTHVPAPSAAEAQPTPPPTSSAPPSAEPIPPTFPPTVTPSPPPVSPPPVPPTRDAYHHLPTAYPPGAPMLDPDPPTRHLPRGAPHVAPTEPPSVPDRKAPPTPSQEPALSPSMAPTQRVPDARAETVYATISFEDQSGRQEYQMKKAQIAVGRGGVDYWVDLKLKTKSDVSHEHLHLRYEEDLRRFYIKDLSTFGTTVNGERIPTSVERVGSIKRDKNVWVPLPNRARIGLADVLNLDFRAEEGL